MFQRIVYYLLVSFLLLQNLSHAQHIRYSDTLALKSIKAGLSVFSGEEYHYLYAFVDKEPLLRIYDEKMKTKQEVVFDFLQGTILHQSFFYHQNKIYSFWILEQGKNLTIQQAVLTPLGLLESLISYPLEGINRSNYKNMQLSFAYSPDKSHAAYAFYNIRNAELHLIRLNIENSFINYIHKQVNLTLKSVYVKDELMMTNNELVYMQFLEKEKWKKDSEFTAVTVWGHNDREVEENIIELLKDDKSYIGDKVLFYDADLDEAAIAFVSTNDKHKTAGKLNIHYLKEGKQSANQVISLKGHILSGINNQFKKVDLYDFRIKNIAKTSGGGYLIGLQIEYVLQKTFRENVGMYGFGLHNTQTRRVREYYFGEYLAVQSHPIESMNWQKIVRKRQKTTDDKGIFSSVKILNTGSQNVLFYNDLHFRKNQVQIAVLEKNGDLIYGQIPYSKLRGMYYAIPELIYVLNQQTVLMPVVYDHKNLGLMEVSFE